MPREDVPYPGAALCSLKERIAELEDEIDELMKSINGVEGDGNGNVQLLSANSALTINSDQVNKQITLDLDPSQLPAAAVTSVNGSTGTVVLDASDVGSTNGDVQTDIDNLESADTTLQGNINNEATARANADAALQTNINAALATIPAAAATAVQNDATVQQLSSDVTALQAADANNVKLSGSQTITGIKEVPLQTTGSYDSQIASSQKVKNELDNYSPMLRTTGNQTKTGTLTMYPSTRYPLDLKGTDTLGNAPGTNFYSILRFLDSSDTLTGSIIRAHLTSGGTDLSFNISGQSGNTASLAIRINPDNTGYMRFTKPDGTYVNLVTW